MNGIMKKLKKMLAVALALLFAVQTPVAVIAEETTPETVMAEETEEAAAEETAAEEAEETAEEEAAEEIVLIEEVAELLPAAEAAPELSRLGAAGGEITENVYWILDNAELSITADSSRVTAASKNAVTGTLDPRYPYEYGEMPWSEHSGEIKTAVVGGSGDAVVPYLMNSWFSGLENLKTIRFEGIDTSQTVSMAELFRGCTLLESLDLRSFDTASVMDMHGMFRDCEALGSVDLEDLKTSEVTDFSEMFLNCRSLTALSVAALDLKKGEKLKGMFQGCSMLTALEFPKFECENAKDLSYVFSGCDHLKVLTFDEAKAPEAAHVEGLFENCDALTELDLSAFEIKDARYADRMFAGCASLKTLDLGGLQTQNVETASEMFAGCTSMKNIDLTVLGTGSLTKVNGMFRGCESLETVKMNKVTNPKESKDLHEMFRGCSSLTKMELRNESENQPAENVIVINGAGVASTAGMFRDCSGLEELNISMNMTNVPDVTDMLAGCTGLRYFTKGPNCRLTGYKNEKSKANLPNPDAAFITGADGYWYTTVNSKEQRYTADQIPNEDTAVQYRACFGTVTYDPNGFHVEPVTDYLEYGKLYTVKGNMFGVGETLTHWTTEPGGGGTAVKFNQTVDPSTERLINVRLYAVWETKPGATVTITWQNDDGTRLGTDTIQAGMMPVYTGDAPEKKPQGETIYVFDGWIPELIIAKEDATYTAHYEERSGGKIQVTWDADNGSEPKVAAVDYGTVPQYDGTPEKTDPEGLYRYSFDHWTPAVTRAITDITYTAVYTKENKNTLYWGIEDGTLTVSSRRQTGKSMSGNFLRDKIFTETSPAPWYAKRNQITAVVIGSAQDTVCPKSLSCWFRDLEYATSFSLTGLDASEAEDASRMFENCRKLQSLDLSGLNTGNVKDFRGMFKDCLLLTGLKLTGMNTASAENMSAMFDGALRLKELDLTGFSTAGVTDFSYMFHDCKYLETLKISRFVTAEAVYMQSMFAGCRNLKELDVSGFSVTKAKDLDSMFEDVTLVRSLDLTGFAVDPKKTSTKKMFLNMLYLDSLKTGPVGDFTKADLPAPDGTRSEGAHGCWIGTDDVGHKPEELPINKADTYHVLYAKVFYDPNGAQGSQAMDYLKSNAQLYGVKGQIYEAPADKYFAGWTLNAQGTGTVYEGGSGLPKEKADALKNKTLYALWKTVETPVATVTWRGANNEVLRVDRNVPYGTVPFYDVTPPVKDADAQYTYTFKEWVPAIKAVDGDAEYKPSYTKNMRSYPVTWVNYDGKVLQGPTMVQYGQTVQYQGKTPVKPADAKYTYEFKGWSPEVGEIRKEVTYTAAFAKHEIPTTKMYHVVFRNYDNKTVLNEQDVEDGTIPTYAGETPTKKEDDTYKYTFAGWDPKIGIVRKDTVYIAKFSSSVKDYLVTYNANGHGKTKTVRTRVGETPMPPEDPKEDGWIFTGWFTTSGCTEKVNFQTFQMPAHAVDFYAGWKKESGGSGGGGGTGGGGSVKTITVNQSQGGATYSRNWKQDAAGRWFFTDRNGNPLKNCWLCDDAIAANRYEVWYLLKEDGSMLDAGLVQDNTGNYYSLEMEHNGYYGRLRTVNGYYDGIWLEFSHTHDGSFGAIKNKEGIEAMKAKYGVTRYYIGNESCVYSSVF